MFSSKLDPDTGQLRIRNNDSYMLTVHSDVYRIIYNYNIYTEFVSESDPSQNRIRNQSDKKSPVFKFSLGLDSIINRSKQIVIST